MRMKRWRWLLLLCLCLTAGGVSARELLQGDSCMIAPEEVITGNVFVLCEELVVAGRIEGNLIGGALRGTITGRIEGSVYLAGGHVVVAGSIQRELHYAGLILWVQPEIPETLPPAEPSASSPFIRGSLLSFALSTRLSETAQVQGGVIGVGYQVILQGQVGGEVNFWGSGLTIGGQIEGNIYASVGDPASDGTQIETLLLPFGFEPELQAPGLRVTDASQLQGNLEYSGPVSGQFPDHWEVPTIFISTTNVPLPTPESPETFRVYATHFFHEMTILLTAGLLGLGILPEIFRAPMSTLRHRAVSSISVGMLTFILSFPIILIMVMLSLALLVILQVLGLSGVVVVLGSILAIANFGGAGIFYFVAIFMARALVAFSLGRFLLRLTRNANTNTRTVIGSMTAGALLLALLISLPVIGWVFNAGALFLGLGSLLTTLLERLQTIRQAAPTAGSTWQTLSAAVAPLPQVSPPAPPPDAFLPAPTEPTATEPPAPLALMPPGMTDLPEGFDMDFFAAD